MQTCSKYGDYIIYCNQSKSINNRCLHRYESGNCMVYPTHRYVFRVYSVGNIPVDFYRTLPSVCPLRSLGSMDLHTQRYYCENCLGLKFLQLLSVKILKVYDIRENVNYSICGRMYMLFCYLLVGDAIMAYFPIKVKCLYIFHSLH